MVVVVHRGYSFDESFLSLNLLYEPRLKNLVVVNFNLAFQMFKTFASSRENAFKIDLS